MIPALVGGGTAVIGTVAGGVSSAMDASNKRKALDAYIKSQQELGNQITQTGEKRVGDINATYNPVTQDFTGNATDYFGALKGTDFSKFDVTAPEEFNFDMAGATQAELNPDIAAIINRSTGAVEQSAANRGGLFSGATAKGIARSTADIQAKEWDAARNRAQQQRTNKYQEFIDTFNNAMKTNEVNRGNYTSNINTKGTLFDAQGKLWGEQQTGVQNINNAMDTANIQNQADINKATSERAGTPGFWSSFGQGALSGLAGSAGGAASAFGSLTQAGVK